MYLLIVFLPLISALITLLYSSKMGKKGAIQLTCTGVILSCIFSYIAFYEVALSGSICHIETIDWVTTGIFNIKWGFLFDTLTVVMLIVVTSISSLVHIYSTSYMSADPNLPRFMSYLSLFTFFMLMLVTANNMIQMFLGWEGVGICSYLLINFWYTRVEANKAAIKAIIINKIGDFGILVGILLLYVYTGSVNYNTMFSVVSILKDHSFTFMGLDVSLLDTIAIFLFIGCVGKSAQIGLHSWLPDAMEGPTPVSALIHAATMVTAGVFMVVRCSPIFEYTGTALIVVTIIGAITSLFAGTIAIVQDDIKKVIAYSTCSQLGYMVFACGLSYYTVSLFHLMNHAFFKALLFLGAGAVIHAVSDYQDMRKMGGLVKLLPFVYTAIVIGSVALMGFPFLTGFYSKDVILELAYSKYTIDSMFSYWFGTISAFITAFYSFRLIYLTFLSKNNSHRIVIEHIHGTDRAMLLPLIVLSLGSIFVGYITKDMFVGLGSDFIGNAIFTHPDYNIIIDSEFMPIYIKLLPVILSIISAILSLIIYTYFKNMVTLTAINYRNVYTFLKKKYYVDDIYNKYIAGYFLNISYNVTFKLIDRGLLEVVGPYGIATRVMNFAKNISLLQSGIVYSYLFVLITGLVSFFILFEIYYGFTYILDDSIYLLLLVLLFFINNKSKKVI
jgi:NADH-ubiquinone oxidoreductase chain 5